MRMFRSIVVWVERGLACSSLVPEEKARNVQENAQSVALGLSSLVEEQVRSRSVVVWVERGQACAILVPTVTFPCWSSSAVGLQRIDSIAVWSWSVCSTFAMRGILGSMTRMRRCFGWAVVAMVVKECIGWVVVKEE